MPTIRMLLSARLMPSSQVEQLSGNAGTTYAAFDGPTEQRLHFKSDWHRFNVKLRSAGKAPVDETEFERLVNDKDEASVASATWH